MVAEKVSEKLKIKTSTQSLMYIKLNQETRIINFYPIILKYALFIAMMNLT